MEELTELIQKLWRDGLLPQRAYAELLSFTNTHQSLQLLQHDVIKSVCDHDFKRCKHPAIATYDKCTKCSEIR